jgi:hypothetical protein
MVVFTNTIIGKFLDFFSSSVNLTTFWNFLETFVNLSISENLGKKILGCEFRFWKLHETYPIFTITNVAYAIGPSVTMSSTDFPFQNLVFWNLFEFSAAEII